MKPNHNGKRKKGKASNIFRYAEGVAQNPGSLPWVKKRKKLRKFIF